MEGALEMIGCLHSASVRPMSWPVFVASVTCNVSAILITEVEWAG